MRADLFATDNYKSFVLQCFSQIPKRGQFQAAAKHLNVHPTLISQVFRGDRDLSPEQGALMAEFLGLNEFETEYLVALIEYSRAGNPPLRRLISQRIQRLREKNQKVTSHIPKSKMLSAEKKAIFYSDWSYAAVHLATSIQDRSSLSDLSNYLDLPRAKVRRILDFLVNSGMCSKSDDNYEMLEARTHIDSSDPLINRHHSNWRLKAIERHEKLSSAELGLSAPFSVSKNDFAKIKGLLLEVVGEITQIVDKTEPEQVSILNIDLLKLR